MAGVNGFDDVKIKSPGELRKIGGILHHHPAAGDQVVVKIVGRGKSGEEQRVKGNQCNDEKEEVKNRFVPDVKLFDHDGACRVLKPEIDEGAESGG